MTLVKVLEIRAIGDFRLHVLFSDGQEGIQDFRDLVFGDGTVVQPLRNPVEFARVFVELGVPTWPNGFAIDAIALHGEMTAHRLLRRSAA